MHTFFGHWVDFKAAVGDFRVTLDAISVIPVLYPPLGHFDSQKIALALAFLCLGHGLLLHGIHARQAADGLLVQHHRGPGLFGEFRYRFQFALSRRQTFPCNFKIDCHVYMLAWYVPKQKSGAREAAFRLVFRRRHAKEGVFMLILILGLVLFLGAHSARIFASDFRDRIIASRGENAWKGPYTLVSLTGFALIIWGFSMARYEGPILYTPPVWMQHVALLIMLLSFISLAVFGMPAGKLKAILKHPMILAVKLWAFAHLLANGDLASLLLFGSFLVWSIVDRISIARRERAGQATEIETGPVRNDIIAALAGFVLYLLFVWKLHEWLIGVPPVTV